MGASTKPYVFDTSSLFALKDDEPGADKVSKILESCGKRGQAFISFATPMEYFYVIYQEQGRERALESYLQLKTLPLQVVESDETLRLIAGEIKATHSLSFADAWVAATAQKLGATLLHKDPEFEPLRDTISLESLPYHRSRQ